MRDCEDNQPVHNDLMEIEKAALRCKKIVQDLLDFSRMSPGKTRAAVDVQQVFAQILVFLRREFLSINVKVKLEIPEDLSPVLGNINRLQQVFLNLLTNAAHSMTKGGTITVRARPGDGDKVVIEVVDTGEGIKAEHLTKIFDPFFTTKDPGKGTGLGLPITYRIIQDHEGSIEVKSSEGEGTCFRITLPKAVENDRILSTREERDR